MHAFFSSAGDYHREKIFNTICFYISKIPPVKKPVVPTSSVFTIPMLPKLGCRRAAGAARRRKRTGSRKAFRRALGLAVRLRGRRLRRLRCFIAQHPCCWATSMLP